MEKRLFKITAAGKSKVEMKIANLLKKESGVKFAYIFGSFVHGLSFHDIDVGIYLSHRLDKDAYERGTKLSVLLTHEIHFPVDVRVLNHAPPSFVYHVLQGHLVYEKDEDFLCRVMEDTVRQYLDLKPILHQATKEAFSS